MRSRFVGAVRACGVLAAVWVVGCNSNDSASNPDVSLAGTYTLTSFVEGGQDLSQAATGTAALTATAYKVNIAFANNIAPTIVDSGTYTATSNGTFSETSLVTGAQSTGTYTIASGLWTVNVTSQGVAIAQIWQKQ